MDKEYLQDVYDAILKIVEICKWLLDCTYIEMGRMAYRARSQDRGIVNIEK